MKNLLSNRAMFKQLLARDVLEILNMLNAGTCVDLVTVRKHLQQGKGDFSLLNYDSKKFYVENCTSKGNYRYCYTHFDDRFYRAIQSINDTGYGITVRKNKQTGKLFAFSTSVLKLDNWIQLIADSFNTWTVDYNRGGK
jgi:hypothetical protein